MLKSHQAICIALRMDLWIYWKIPILEFYFICTWRISSVWRVQCSTSYFAPSLVTQSHPIAPSLPFLPSFWPPNFRHSKWYSWTSSNLSNFYLPLKRAYHPKSVIVVDAQMASVLVLTRKHLIRTELCEVQWCGISLSVSIGLLCYAICHNSFPLTFPWMCVCLIYLFKYVYLNNFGHTMSSNARQGLNIYGAYVHTFVGVAGSSSRSNFPIS